MVAVVSNTLMEWFPDVLHDFPGNLSWNCAVFLLNSFLQDFEDNIRKAFPLGTPKVMTPVLPLYRQYSLYAVHSKCKRSLWNLSNIVLKPIKTKIF